MKKTFIDSIKGNWMEVVDACRATVSKPPLGKEPSEDFKKKILISEHSPIRSIAIRWKWEGIPSWVATHFARHHEGWEKWISTQRSDRTGINRNKMPQDAPVNYTGEANTQSLINVAKVRLCYQAAKETREQFENLKYELNKIEPEISNVLVPSCVYRCGCPELKSCGFFEGLKKKYPNFSEMTIQERYDAYNAEFYKK